MILRHLFFNLLLLLSHSTVFTNTDDTANAIVTQQTNLIIEELQTKIVELSSQQSELSTKKNSIQKELHKTITQLEKTRCEQEELSKDIIELNLITKNLTCENEQLSEQLTHLTKEKKQLDEKIAYTENEKRRLEDNLISTQEELSLLYSREKEITRSQLTSETKFAQELHRFQKNIIELQEKIADSSWADAFEKHTAKLITSFIAGSFITYTTIYYIAPETI